MTTRRTFLSAAVMGTAAAFTPLFAQGQSTSGAAATGAGPSGGRPLPTNERSTSGRYRPPYRFGMGGVAIGNGFKPTTDAQAQETLEAAWIGACATSTPRRGMAWA
jgi:D-threo-aldose 1-dehydrogenase